jgi:putative ABC transport system substrate-binding protein
MMATIAIIITIIYFWIFYLTHNIYKMKFGKSLFLIASFFLLISCKNTDKETQVHYHIGVNQYTSHSILNEVYKGFKETIETDSLFIIDFQNSNADVSTMNLINEQFIAKKMDLIVALGTPVAQSIIEKTKNTQIPVVFGAITDPVGAGLAETLEMPGGNKTGSTNMWPFEAQVRLIRQLFPNAKSVGAVVNNSEKNCTSGMEIMKPLLLKYGFKYAEVQASNSNEVMIAALSIAKQSDILIISPSNTVVSGISGLIKAAEQYNKPIMGGDKISVQKGSVATFCYEDYDIGVATANIVFKILRDKQKPGELPIAKPNKTYLFINEDQVVKYNIILPDSMRKEAIILN